MFEVRPVTETPARATSTTVSYLCGRHTWATYDTSAFCLVPLFRKKIMQYVAPVAICAKKDNRTRVLTARVRRAVVVAFEPAPSWDSTW